MNAGRSVPLTVSLPAGAPDGGQVVTFTTANAAIATVAPSSVTFNTGETSKTIAVTGVTGGSVKLSALVQGIERASSTIVVQGGVVDGFVFDPDNHPVVGAEVTMTGGNTLTATTDANGFYEVVGITAPFVTVSAVDPATQLRGTASANLNASKGFAHVNVTLTLTATVHGTVRMPNGQTAVGSGVEVDLFASNNLLTPVRSTFTDASGAYQITEVGPGNYVVEANGTNANRGRANVTVSTAGQATPDPTDIAFLGRGTVTGTVFNAAGQPVPGAALTFTNTSIFGATVITRDALPDGTFRFDQVFIGTFSLSARDQGTNRAATRTGSIISDGQLVDHQDLVLAPYNSVHGTVYRFDRVTTVPNAMVSLVGQLNTVTDALGRYEFAIVPTGPVTVNVSDAATRGKGAASGTVTEAAPLTLDVYLLGQGSVVATVVTAKGVPESGAFVTVSSVNGAFHDALNGIAGANGIAVLDKVLAGDITASATSNGLTAPLVHGTLSPDGVLPLTITLEPTGSIAGVVFAPDGETPQETGTVQLLGPTALPVITLGTGGTFRFDRLKLGQYQINARDTKGFLRATTLLNVQGDDTPATLTFVAAGSIIGRVINPEGLSAPNLIVQARSLNPQFGRFANTLTKSAGDYRIDSLAAGVITVSASDPARGLLGEASGRIEQDGQVLTLDILLTSNGITLPKTLLDANTFQFDVQPGGYVGIGTANTFSAGAGTSGGSLLDIVEGGAPIRFVGNTVGTIEGQGRELVIRQQNVASLDVTRKIFVPQDGYFSRYLELLSNPTAVPITVDVRVTSVFKGNTAVAADVVNTSSGDAVLDVADATSPDRWVVVDDAETDPFNFSSIATTAVAFGGNGGTDAVDTAALTTPSSAAKQLTYEWTNVTVPPGVTVAYMHFLVQQPNRAGAAAAADRLVQLPPEALAGLDPDEIAPIQNFAVPADGVSTMGELPPLSGSISGRLLASDGSTAIANATVTFKSGFPFFGRTPLQMTDRRVCIRGELTGTSTQTVFLGTTLSPSADRLKVMDGRSRVSRPRRMRSLRTRHRDRHGDRGTSPMNGVPVRLKGASPRRRSTSQRRPLSGQFLFTAPAASYQIPVTPVVILVTLTAGQTLDAGRHRYTAPRRYRARRTRRRSMGGHRSA